MTEQATELREVPVLSETKNVYRVRRLAVAAGLVVSLVGALVFIDDPLGDRARRFPAIEEKKALQTYSYQFANLSPEEQYEAQYISGRDITVPTEYDWGNGILSYFTGVDANATTTISVGWDCLADTPYNTSEGAVIASEPEGTTTDAMIYTVYPTTGAPPLEFRYAESEFRGAMFPSNAHAYNVLAAKPCDGWGVP